MSARRWPPVHEADDPLAALHEFLRAARPGDSCVYWRGNLAQARARRGTRGASMMAERIARQAWLSHQLGAVALVQRRRAADGEDAEIFEYIAQCRGAPLASPPPRRARAEAAP